MNELLSLQAKIQVFGLNVDAVETIIETLKYKNIEMEIEPEIFYVRKQFLSKI